MTYSQLISSAAGHILAHFAIHLYTFGSSLLSLSDTVLTDSSLPDELLYGRAGYLYALLFIRRYLGQDAVEQKLIDKVRSNWHMN